MKPHHHFAGQFVLRIATAAIVTTICTASVVAQTLSDLETIKSSANDALMRKDYPEALRLNLKAAELGDAQAQNNVGAIFQDGLGVDRNYNEAMKWYRMAANSGNIQAEKNLGDTYIAITVPAKCRDPDTGEVSLGCFWLRKPNDPNEVEALKWYLRAGEKGHAGAMTNLGWMYALGYGVKTNCITAGQWLKKAATAGNEAAIANLKRGLGICRW